jgi:type II secretory pathway pseudopilin PulG
MTSITGDKKALRIADCGLPIGKEFTFKSAIRNRGAAFTLVELLVVITIITFVAGALVVAAQGVMKRAAYNNTVALVQRVTTACAMFNDDFGYFPPDDWPITTDAQCYTADRAAPENPTQIQLFPNANCMLRLLYLYPQGHKQYLSLKQSELRGGFSASWVNVASPSAAGRFEFAFPDTADPEKGLIVVDAWGRPLYYDCHTSDPGVTFNYATGGDRSDKRRPILGNIYPAVHLAKGADIFSCGADGLTTPNNGIDDNQNGSVDSADSLENYQTIGSLRVSMLAGEADDDINNWWGR